MFPALQPKVAAKWDNLVSETLMGKRQLLLEFTLSPVELEKLLSNPFRMKSFFASSGRMSNVSSAYCTMGKKSSKSFDSG